MPIVPSFLHFLSTNLKYFIPIRGTTITDIDIIIISIFFGINDFEPRERTLRKSIKYVVGIDKDTAIRNFGKTWTGFCEPLNVITVKEDISTRVFGSLN